MKNLFNKVHYSIALIFCIITTHASASKPSNIEKMHISIKSGGSFLSDNIYNVAFSKKHDSSVLYGAGIGYNFNEKFALDFALTNRHNYQYSIPNSTEVPGASGDATQNFNIATFMLEGYYTPPTKWKVFSPYLVVGVGMSYGVMSDFIFKTDINDETTIIGKNNTNFSWLIGIGTSAKINNSFSLNIGYHYIGLGTLFTRDTAVTSLDKARYIGEDLMIGGPAYAHEYVLELVYKF